MSPKWTAPEQEEFLERWYVRYLELKYERKRSPFKEFWVSLQADWVQKFGWNVEQNAESGGAPSLEKVSGFLCVWTVVCIKNT